MKKYISRRSNLVLLSALALGVGSAFATMEPATGSVTAAEARPDFARMRANCAGTDWLKVGLWSFPMVFDWDRDGRPDLVVSTYCYPDRGVYFFRNLGNDLFAPAVRLSQTTSPNVVLTHTAGRDVVTGPWGAIWNFRGWFGSGDVKPLDGVPVNPHPHEVRGNVRRFVDFDGDGRDDVVIGVGCWRDYGWHNCYDEKGVWQRKPIQSAIYICRNQSGCGPGAKYAAPVELRLKDGGAFETYGNPSPMFEDWDGDGDLDLICGSFIDDFYYFENVGSRTNPQYVARGKLTDEQGKRMTMELEMIRPSAFDWDGDGNLDLVVGDEDGRVAWMKNLSRMKDGRPLFARPVYFRQQRDWLCFGALATPWAADWDGDGDTDLICGNSAGHLAFIENKSGKCAADPSWGEPKFLCVAGQPIRIQAGDNGSIQGPAERKWGYTVPTVADWDGDGFPDVIINSIFGDIVWYRNPGKKGTLELESARPVEVEWKGKQPALDWGWRKPQGKALLTQWRTTPVTIDWNRDGLVDLIMLDTEGYLAYFERFRDASGKLRLKSPRRIFVQEDGAILRLNPHTGGNSGRRKLCFCDWDGDGRLDLIANSKIVAECWRNLGETNGCTRFAAPVELGVTKLASHTTSPTAADLDGNGRPEIIVGAEDGFLYKLGNR